MQNLTELPPVYLTELAKLNELLRMYQVAKKSKTFHLVSDKTKQVIGRTLQNLRKFTVFSESQQDVLAKINKVLQENKSPPQNRSTIKKLSQSNNSEQGMGSANKSQSGKSEQSSINKQGNSIKKAVSIYVEQPQKQSNVSVASKSQHKSQPQVKLPSALSHRGGMKPEQKKQKQVKAVEKKQQIKQQKNQVLASLRFVKVQNKEQIKQQKPKAVKEVSFAGQQMNPHLKWEPVPHPQVLISMSKLQEGQIKSSSSGSLAENQNNLVQTISSINSGSLEVSESFCVLNFSENSQSKMEKQEISKEDDNQSIISQKISQSSSNEEVAEIIAKFCLHNKEQLNFCLLFNNELFQQMDQELNGHFYLFGVNRPESKHIKQLYACTLMKFLTAELFRSESKFQKQLKDFKNSIRIPLGLIFKGEGPNAINPEHIKFLLAVQSPHPVMLVLKDDEAKEGCICTFSQSIIQRIRITPRKDLGQCAQQLKTQTYVLPYNEKHFPADKNKVMTKFLAREIPNFPEQAPNAITISGNDCIKEEKNCFTYKLHLKYFQQMKNNEYFIYYVNNNVINARTLFTQKQIEAFKKQATQNQSKLPMILGFSVVKDTNPIKREFFEILLQCKNKRDPFFFLNYVALSVKKTIVALLRPEVTFDSLKSAQGLQYKDFEKDTVLTQCIHVIAKNNIRQFETEGKQQVITVNPK